jgi:exodeoxyribonuclease V gamma subunit
VVVLLVHRSERADHLVDDLGDLLLNPLDDPMAREVVAVPTRGVERWLTQRLSHRLGAGYGRGDGVCANLQFPFPGTLIGTATALACGFNPDSDPWPPERSVWPLMDLVDAHLDEGFLSPLARHLRASSPDPSKAYGLRRFSVLRHLADLYDQYSVHRPGMILSWASGSYEGTGSDGRHSWQADLWRLLRDWIGTPSPAERFEAASARLADVPDLLDLPARISLFGLTRLPPSYLQLLEAIARRRDVHLFLLHPSAALWDKVEAQGLSRHQLAGLRRSEDPTARLPANPLLRSWGRDSREMQLVLRAREVAAGRHRAVPAGAPTLLGLIQADIRADRRPPGPAQLGQPDPRPLLASDDTSLRIHSCHGRARQVEVMRDAILHLLADDPSLEPRDVIVMCPDIESFAPLVHAAFSSREEMVEGSEPSFDEQSLPALRIRLADRSLRQTNALLAVAAHLLELAGGRVTGPQVLDFASREPVSRRFGLDEEDLWRIERWVEGSGIRWGLDGGHRERWQLGDLEANTWRAGIDRLALGVAMTEEGDRLFGNILPFDAVSSSEVELAGQLVEMVERLGAAVRDLTGPRPVGEWAEALDGATESLAAAGPGERWQHDQLRRTLEEVARQSAGGGAHLQLAEFRSLLGARLQGRPTRANFRTGDLTLCTLVPMRSVPHRVVGLLGLDDDSFPRRRYQDGDDILLASPVVGDRDARSEDRQLLLDALLAATEHLVITYEGRDQRHNRERPPAVPVAELLDTVDRTVRLERTASARQAVVVEHPLHSFDHRNFLPGALKLGGPWGYDPVNLEAARVGARPRRPRAPFLAGPLPAAVGTEVSLQSLVRFVKNPVREFLRTRLGIYPCEDRGGLQSAVPVELDNLEKWGVGDRLLRARLEGIEMQRACAAEVGRGLLPPGALGEDVLADVASTVESLVDGVLSLPCAKVEPTSIDIRVPLPDQRSLVGTVAGVRQGTILTCAYSRLAPSHRLVAWVLFLALTAARPDLRVSAVTITRPSGRQTSANCTVARIDPLAGHAGARQALALGYLGAVIDLYDRGLREPLPLCCKTSAAWAEARRSRRDPTQDCLAIWTSQRSSQVPGEDRDPAHILAFGNDTPFDALCEAPPADGEDGPGWATDEPHRFGRLARRLWDPLLEHEVLEKH